MDCYKQLFSAVLENKQQSTRTISRLITSCLCLFLFPLSANAQQGSADFPLVPFLLGVSLPFVIFIVWYVFIKKSPKEQDHVITKDELYTYTHDLTTNLPTAQHALKQFEHALKSNSASKMAAIVFKPINFKQVNTVLGHHNSDILLLQLAYCLQKTVVDNQSLLSFDRTPEPVRLARLQGLDFLVVFDLSTSKHEPKDIIDNLCSQLATAVPDAMSFKSFSLNFELAFGVAISDEHGDSVNEIVSHATDALLQAESQEQTIQYFDNSAVLYTEQQLALMESLRQDILNEDLRWYLQPQVNLDDNSLIGFELKVHWYHNDEKPMELSEFIDLAEHSGEVYHLTKQMFKQAFKVLFTLHKMGVYQRVSVSLSSKNLLEPDLVDYIEQQMKNFNIAGKYLMIELNENMMLSACQRAKNIIDQLKSLDITIAIFNFSGSYESLRYLRKMTIHQVKINCQQLASSESNSADKAIINALITLTRSMQIPLIGTHIDKHEAANQYVAMGGKLIQGDIINKGVVPDEIEIWLKRWFSQHPESKPKVL
jgi:EAL domain-containing protein (putative c-di-GMP-specific phosphodiesterase class I)/GGDEF domain-containing protein